MDKYERLLAAADAVWEALIGPYPNPYSELEQAYFGIYLFGRLGRPNTIERLTSNLNSWGL